LRQVFGYAEQPNFPPRFNVAPTQPVPVIIIENGVRHFRLMRWGFLPAWIKDPRQFSLVINARSETVLEKPAFKNAIKRRRCLIPADGYYEWHTSDNRKRPYFIHRRDGQPVGFAALAETWMGPNGEELDTVAIVTAAASPDLATLHHRVPVTIAPADFERWLDGRADDCASRPRGSTRHPVSDADAASGCWTSARSDPRVCTGSSDHDRAGSAAVREASREGLDLSLTTTL